MNKQLVLQAVLCNSGFLFSSKAQGILIPCPFFLFSFILLLEPSALCPFSRTDALLRLIELASLVHKDLCGNYLFKLFTGL